EISVNVNTAVVAIDERVFIRVFKPRHGRACLNKRRAAVRFCDQIRDLTEDVATAAIADEVRSQDAEALEKLKIQVHETAPARCRVSGVVRRIPKLEVPLDAAKFEMELFVRV